MIDAAIFGEGARGKKRRKTAPDRCETEVIFGFRSVHYQVFRTVSRLLYPNSVLRQILRRIARHGDSKPSYVHLYTPLITLALRGS
jgi:hypothetical protein